MPVQPTRTINLKRISLLSSIGLLGFVVVAFLGIKLIAPNLDQANDVRIEKKENSLVTESPLKHFEMTEPRIHENSVPNYYDQLPPLEAVISQYRNLELVEIDQKIEEIEEELTNNSLIEKANAKILDESGYRELARLIQLSDALYNLKIEHQLSALELELEIKKKGA